jgi:ethanolamine utilization microcompartment shell protein EutL
MATNRSPAATLQSIPIITAADLVAAKLFASDEAVKNTMAEVVAFLHAKGEQQLAGELVASILAEPEPDCRLCREQHPDDVRCSRWL